MNLFVCLPFVLSAVPWTIVDPIIWITGIFSYTKGRTIVVEYLLEIPPVDTFHGVVNTTKCIGLPNDLAGTGVTVPARAPSSAAPPTILFSMLS